LQFLGYVIDVLWHGVVFPGAEPRTKGDMVRHLATVHLPLYVGAASVFVSTSTLFLRRLRRSTPGTPLSIAFAGAVVSAGAEAGHAYSHLQLDTHSGPVAGTLSIIGFVVVIIAMSVCSRSRGRGGAGAPEDRRAA